ncbi:MAG: ribonuclease H-like domain-containing protein [Clostridiales bacterium]|nr:ribonuclease H-like domain-containing protein [Clostridiales bacterium]
MEIIKKSVSLSCSTDLTDFTPNNRAVFLDIETTGLSAEHCSVYLIGCCYPENGEWQFIQWFAETPEEEAEILEKANDFFQNFDLLIHFNGDHFDLPFLHRRAEFHGIPNGFLSGTSLDIYRQMKSCRRLLNLPNNKLKTLQAFLGFGREDEYNGGQLIEVYHQYSRMIQQYSMAVEKYPEISLPEYAWEARHLLLLHNEEDILGMPDLLSALVYPAFLSGTVKAAERLTWSENDSTATVLLRLDTTAPVPVHFHTEFCSGIWKEDKLQLTVSLFTGELKYFFPNYREYYYLPEEDTAIHESVAAYVDKNFRKKASPNTAYVRKNDTYFPLPADMEERIFRLQRKGTPYIPVTSVRDKDQNFWTIYLRQLVSLI